MVNIAIVDDHQLFRNGLALLLKSINNVSVVLEANNGKELLEKLKDCDVDLILMDIQMPEMNGYEACKSLHKLYPDIKIMIVCDIASEECVKKVIELGAHGFFPKSFDSNLLSEAIELILSQGYYFAKLNGNFVSEHFFLKKIGSKKNEFKGTNFTTQELLVLKMAIAELNSGEIAHKLNINIRTVDSHRKKIMIKTGSKNFIGAILFAIKHQYIALE